MDQQGVKEAENNPKDSANQREDDAATAGKEDNSDEESMDQRAGYNKAEESAGLLVKEVGSGESSPRAALFAHPCSLLQLLLRACAGCLGLHGYCSSDPKPAAVAAAPEAATAAADSSQEGEGGDKANGFYMQGEVVTQVWAVRRPRPPNHPSEGGGGNGGVHH